MKAPDVSLMNGAIIKLCAMYDYATSRNNCYKPDTIEVTHVVRNKKISKIIAPFFPSRSSAKNVHSLTFYKS